MKTKLLPLATLLLVVGLSAASALAEAGTQANGSKASEGAQPGLLDFDIQSAVWVLVIFIVLGVVLYRTAWRNVLTGLKGREARIRKDIADAEAARAKGEAVLREYNAQLATAENKVRELLSKAAADAEALATQIRTRAQHDAEETRERALKDIEAARDQALSEIYEHTADLATRVAEKIIRRNLNSADQRELVNQSLQELQTAGAG